MSAVTVGRKTKSQQLYTLTRRSGQWQAKHESTISSQHSCRERASTCAHSNARICTGGSKDRRTMHVISATPEHRLCFMHGRGTGRGVAAEPKSITCKRSALASGDSSQAIRSPAQKHQMHSSPRKSNRPLHSDGIPAGRSLTAESLPHSCPNENSTHSRTGAKGTPLLGRQTRHLKATASQQVERSQPKVSNTAIPMMSQRTAGSRQGLGFGRGRTLENALD